MKKIILTFGISLFAAFAIHVASTNPEANLKKITNISNPDSLKEKSDLMESKINKTEQEWKNELTPEEYYVLREKGTERAYTGEFWNHFEDGVYKCSGCGEPLFSSETKFDSHCGWPSYFQPIDKSKIIYQEDRSHGMIRTEVMCARCGGHLGHVFDDGPQPTGLRYCINSVSLDFEKAAEKK